jgi:hypothetical protein
MTYVTSLFENSNFLYFQFENASQISNLYHLLPLGLLDAILKI